MADSSGIFLVPALIAANAYFVAAEFALVASRSPQIEALRALGRERTAKSLERLKANPASALATIQIFITLIGLVTGSILGEQASLNLFGVDPESETLNASILRVVSFGLSFFVVTVLTVVFSELLPKAMTLRHIATVATYTAYPIWLLLQVAKPVVLMMNMLANLVTIPLGLGRIETAEDEFYTADDIRVITSEAARSGALSDRERSLILNSLALGRRNARQIMVPRVKVAFLDMQKSMDDNRRVMNEHLYSRLPLCNGGIDNVIGIVPTREFLAAYAADGDTSVMPLLARPGVFAPSSIPLDKLLIVIDEKRTQMVILVDEHGGVEGIVTLRDLVDELVGKPLIRRADDAITRPLFLGGETPLHELAHIIGHEIISETSVVTLGGLITERLGRFPRRGDEVPIDSFLLKVIEVDNRVVRRVEVVVSET